MNRYIHILLFIAALFVLGCKKKSPITHVTGTVVNTGTKQPIEGVLVEMQDGISSGGGWVSSGSSNTVGTGKTQQITTGVDGHFSFSFEGEAPVIWAKKSQYRFLNPDGAYEIYLLTAGKDYSNLQLTMDAYAYYAPIFISSTRTLETDSFKFTDVSYLNGDIKWWDYRFVGKGPFQLFGSQLAIGDKYRRYKIGFTKNGGAFETKLDSIYIKSFTTFCDTIYY